MYSHHILTPSTQTRDGRKGGDIWPDRMRWLGVIEEARQAAGVWEGLSAATLLTWCSEGFTEGKLYTRENLLASHNWPDDQLTKGGRRTRRKEVERIRSSKHEGHMEGHIEVEGQTPEGIIGDVWWFCFRIIHFCIAFLFFSVLWFCIILFFFFSRSYVSSYSRSFVLAVSFVFFSIAGIFSSLFFPETYSFCSCSLFKFLLFFCFFQSPSLPLSSVSISSLPALEN